MWTKGEQSSADRAQEVALSGPWRWGKEWAQQMLRMLSLVSTAVQLGRRDMCCA